jgi:hypothetical protein
MSVYPLYRRQERATEPFSIEYNGTDMTKTSRTGRVTDGQSMVRHIPTIEQTKLAGVELAALGLEDDTDIGLLQVEHHVHPEGRICITAVVAELHYLGPIPLPIPTTIIHASQPWDDGGAHLDPQRYE